MNIHKLAKYFPVLEGEEFDLLVQDIKDHGQLEPIVTVNGEILDGVNRYRACQQLEIEPIAEEYEGDDPLSYVVSLNIRRRHMDKSQRAMLATEMLPEFEKIGKQRMKDGAGFDTQIEPHSDEAWESRIEAGKMFGVSGPTIQRAKRVKEEAPDRVGNIIKGKESVTAVDAELRQARASERAAEQKDKQTTKTVKQEYRGVAEYFDAIKIFRERLQLTIEGAKREQWFARESINIVINKHNQIREMLAELEGSI